MTTADAKSAGGLLRGQHPGLLVMSMTEIWERMAYYGMRAILVLYLVDTDQGFSLDKDYAAAMFGLFLSMAYMTSLLGGWIGDRVLGATSAIILGAVFLMLGNFTLALAPELNLFYLGLFFIVIGISLLKPNISAVISFLYPEGGARRDHAFYIFYLAINLGALFGPFVTAGVSSVYGYRAGLACAGFGMVLGIAQLIFALQRGAISLRLGQPETRRPLSFLERAVIGGTAIAVVAVAAAIVFGDIRLDINSVIDLVSIFLLFLAVGYFGFLFFIGDLTSDEKKNVGGLLILFFGAVLFYLGLSQPGSSFNLFTLEYTNRVVRGYEIPTGWFQAINPAFTLLLTPLFAKLWLDLAAKDANPPVAGKFAIAIACTAAAFASIGVAALLVTEGRLASPLWLVLTYFAQTCAEIILIPIGLSFVTKLMPDRYVGQGMGIWFLSVSIGYLLGGRYAGAFDYSDTTAMGVQFLTLATAFGVAAVLLAVLIRPARPLFARVE